MSWPRLDLASKLVLDHMNNWNGGYYEALAPAGGALEHDHPKAAAVLYRALLDDILMKGRSQAYGYAARYFNALSLLAMEDFTSVDLIDHHAYVASLRKAHGRKAGFWSILDGGKR